MALRRDRGAGAAEEPVRGGTPGLGGGKAEGTGMRGGAEPGWRTDGDDDV